MDMPTDGPQAATRHAKDRRPAFNTKAARSLAAAELRTEQRLAHLEGKQTASPPAVKTSAALDLDTELNTFGQMFNGIEERVTDLEKADEPQGGVERRLTTLIEERIKPYDQYKKDAEDAVHQLRDFHQRMRSSSTAAVDDATSKLVNEHEASLREFSSRLLQVEDQNELAKAQPLSTLDLAKALLSRLKRGDVLAQKTSHDLRLALDGTSDDATSPLPIAPPRLPDTPATEEDRARPDAIEDSVEDGDESPKKRRRIRQMPRSAKLSSRIAESEAVSTPQCESALSQFTSGGFAVDDEDDGDEAEDVEMEDVVIPPEVRRTSRKPKPTKHPDEMVHWKEANKRMRGMRGSA